MTEEAFILDAVRTPRGKGRASGSLHEVPPARLAVLPTAPENMVNTQVIDDEFWLENLDRLNERFNKWAAR